MKLRFVGERRLVTLSRLGFGLAAAVAALAASVPGAGGAGAAAVITTVAGNGRPGYSGDLRPATAALIHHPRGIAVEPDGGFLFADAFNHRIRRVFPDGTIATVAGNGTAAYSGDGGPATAASLNLPHGVALLPDGGFLIADALNNRIRRVAPNGTITTVAGTGQAGFSGDGGPAVQASIAGPHAVASLPDGSFLIADTENNRIRRVGPDGTITTVAGAIGGYSGDGGPATAARLRRPFGVAPLPDGGLLIADTLNNRIRRVSPDGTITTVAGTGGEGFGGDGGPATNAQLNGPHNVAALADGGFLIADTFNNRVRRVSADGTITTVAGTGAAGYTGDGGDPTAAALTQPKAVAVVGTAGFLIADAENNRVRLVATDRSGATTIKTVAGRGFAGYSGDRRPATAAMVNHPRGLAAMPGGGFLFADVFNHTIRRVFADGTVATVAGTGDAGFSGDRGPAASAELNVPEGVAALPRGGFLIADTLNQRIRRVSATGTITTVAGSGVAGFGGDGGPATAAKLSFPPAVAPLAGGGFLIADTFNQRIRRVLPNGRITTVAGTGNPGFSGDGGRATAARLKKPFGVAALRDGGFLIADTGNNRIRRVTATGVITTVAGSSVAGYSGDGGRATAARLKRPLAVAAILTGGFLIADTGNQRVRRVTPDGRITTVAGSGARGFAGDGGAPMGARLDQPQAVTAVGASGFLIADTENNRIRFVSLG